MLWQNSAKVLIQIIRSRLVNTFPQHYVSYNQGRFTNVVNSLLRQDQYLLFLTGTTNNLINKKKTTTKSSLELAKWPYRFSVLGSLKKIGGGGEAG